MDAVRDTGQPKRRRLRVAGFVSGAFFLLVGIAVALLVAVDLGRFKNPILAAASHAIGRKVSIDGALSIDVGRTIRIRAESLQVSNPTWAPDEPMLRVGDLTVTLRAASLLFGPTVFEQISLRDVQARFTENEHGEQNWRVTPEVPPSARARGRVLPPLIVEVMSVRDAYFWLVSPDLETPLHVALDAIDQRIEGDRLVGRVRGSVGSVVLSFESNLAPRQHIRMGGEVNLDFSGQLGAVELVGRVDFDDLFEPSRPALDVTLKGPSIEYLLDILNLPPVTSGPLDLDVALVAGSDRVDLSTVGDVGEFAIRVDGWLSDLYSAERMDLEVHVAGPNLSYLGPLTGIEGLPSSPFEASGRWAKSGDGATFDALRLSVHDAAFQLEGSMPSFPDLAGADMRLRVRGSDLEPFGVLLQVPGRLAGAFELDVRLLGEAGGTEQLTLDGKLGDLSTQATAKLGDSDNWIGTRVDFDIRGPDLAVVGSAAAVDGIPSLPFHVAGAVQYAGDRIRLVDVSARVEETRARLAGDLDLDWPGSHTGLRVDLESPDLRRILATFGIGGAPAKPLRAHAQLTLSDGWLQASDFEAKLGGTRVKGSISARVEPLASPLRFDLSADAGSLAELSPDTRRFRAAPIPVQATLRGAFDSDRLEFRDTSVRLGDAHFKVTGVIDRPPRLDATQLRIEAEGPSLAQLGSSDLVRLPDLPFSVRGEFEGSPNVVRGRAIAAAVGDSAITLDLVLEDAPVPSIAINAKSESLDLRPFSDPRVETRAKTAVGGRLIPDFDLPVEWLSQINGTADISIGEVTTHATAYREVRLRGTLTDGALRVAELRALGGRGRLDAELAYVPTAARQYALQTTVLGKEIRFAPSIDESAERFLAGPSFDLDLDVRGEGTTLRRLLATLDGRVVMRGGKGVVQDRATWLSRLFSGDFVTEVFDAINPFADRSDDLTLECVVLLLDIQDGRVSGDPAFVLQTEQANILAAGRLDLDTEQLEFIFRTQARWGLGLSLSAVNPFTKLEGSLSAPTLSIDRRGALLEGGLAVATSGLSVLAKSLQGRFLSAKDPCGEALKEYRETHERP